MLTADSIGKLELILAYRNTIEEHWALSIRRAKNRRGTLIHSIATYDSIGAIPFVPLRAEVRKYRNLSIRAKAQYVDLGLVSWQTAKEYKDAIDEIGQIHFSTGPTVSGYNCIDFVEHALRIIMRTAQKTMDPLKLFLSLKTQEYSRVQRITWKTMVGMRKALHRTPCPPTTCQR
jgi:hypothetical protein